MTLYQRFVTWLRETYILCPKGCVRMRRALGTFETAKEELVKAEEEMLAQAKSVADQEIALEDRLYELQAERDDINRAIARSTRVRSKIEELLS